MGFGSSPSPPAAQPVTPVPQQDDPKSLEAKSRAALAAKGREGDSAHLLAKPVTDESNRRAPNASTVY